MTLSTSAKRIRGGYFTIYLMIALFCGIFAYIYELFSHGVYSNAMIYMFLYPLVLGALPALYLRVNRKKDLPRIAHDGVILLTFGSLVTGILEIYGTTSVFTKYYYIAGILCYVTGVLFYLRYVKKTA